VPFEEKIECDPCHFWFDCSFFGSSVQRRTFLRAGCQFQTVRGNHPPFQPPRNPSLEHFQAEQMRQTILSVACIESSGRRRANSQWPVTPPSPIRARKPRFAAIADPASQSLADFIVTCEPSPPTSAIPSSIAARRSSHAGRAAQFLSGCAQYPDRDRFSLCSSCWPSVMAAASQIGPVTRTTASSRYWLRDILPRTVRCSHRPGRLFVGAGEYDTHRSAFGVPQGGSISLYAETPLPARSRHGPLNGVDFRRAASIGHEVVRAWSTAAPPARASCR